MEELNKLVAVNIPIETETNSNSIQPVIETQTTIAAPQLSTAVELSSVKNEKTENKSNESSSVSFALSLIQSNRSREQKIESSAVAQANEVAQSAVAQAETVALETATSSSNQSIDMSKDSVKIDAKETKTSSNTGLTLISSMPSSMSQINANITQQSQSLSTQISLYVSPLSQQQSSNNNGNNTNTATGLYIRPEVNMNLAQPTQEIVQPLEIKPIINSNNSNFNAQPIEQPNNNVSLFNKRGDPLSDYIEQNNIMLSMTQPEVKSTTVKKDVQDNDLANGVKIENMAVTPVGFNVYSLMLRDVAFYEPKEIYKNVVIKDNVRTMYFIEKGNTDTYNKMVDSQYK
jgi:hypothetical protein